MSACAFEEKVSFFVDGELPATEVRPFEEHLAACEPCRSAVEALRGQAGELDAAFAPLRARAEAAVPRIIAALPASPPASSAAAPPSTGSAVLRPRWPLLVPFLSAAAGFLAAVALFAWAPVGPLVPSSPISLVPPPAPTPPPPPRPLPVEKPLAPVVATLAVATGALEEKDGEAWRPLASGASIRDGGWVRTVGRAKGSFSCADGSEVRLNAGTEVQLASRSVVLAKGEIYTQVAKDPTRTFSVSTDAGRIEALGTVLDIAHSEATSLTVIEGRARVGDRTIDAGYSCWIERGAANEPTRADKLATLACWVNEIVAVHGSGSAEFQARINEMLRLIGRGKAQLLDEEEIRSLGDHCALPLTRYVQSKESKDEAYVRHRAARILADVASRPSLGDLLALLEDDDAEVRVQAARGIERLTGSNGGYPRATWTSPGYVENARAWRAALGDPRSPWSEDRKK